MRLTAQEKQEIIGMVEQSEMAVNRSLAQLGIAKSTYYKWYKAYGENGFESFPHLVAVLNIDSHVFPSSCWNVGNATPGSCALGHLPYFNRKPLGVLYPNEP